MWNWKRLLLDVAVSQILDLFFNQKNVSMFKLLDLKGYDKHKSLCELNIFFIDCELV